MVSNPTLLPRGGQVSTSLPQYSFQVASAENAILGVLFSYFRASFTERVSFDMTALLRHTLSFLEKKDKTGPECSSRAQRQGE